jgi:hypothetical protein
MPACAWTATGKALSFLVLGDIGARVQADCIPVNSPYRKALQSALKNSGVPPRPLRTPQGGIEKNPLR